MIWPAWVMLSTMLLVSSATAAVYHEMLTPKYSKLFTVLIFLPGSMLIRFFRVYSQFNMPLFPSSLIVDALILPIYAFLFLRLVCKDKTMKIILFIILIRGLTLFSDNFSSYIYYIIYKENISAFVLNGNQSVFVAFIPSLSITLSLIAFLFIWKNYIGSIPLEIPNIGSFILVLSGYLIMALLISLHGSSLEGVISPFWSLGIVVWIISYVAALRILFTNSKKKEAEENLKELEYIRELEKMHYDAIEARRHELIKIRHDFNNQLATVQHLIDISDKENAENLIDELKKSINSTTEFSFCQNAIVNAVLTEKQKACELEKIRLSSNIMISEEYRISPIHLCSIFSNLLDNAINACKLVTEDQRQINLLTVIKGDYLHIKCVNPVIDENSKEQKTEVFKTKGYGKIILSDIANHYHGNFIAERIDNEYVAMISLLVREGEFINLTK